MQLFWQYQVWGMRIWQSSYQLPLEEEEERRHLRLLQLEGTLKTRPLPDGRFVRFFRSLEESMVFIELAIHDIQACAGAGGG